VRAATGKPLLDSWAGPLLVSLGVLALDRLSKLIVHHGMSLGQSVEIFGDFLRLTYIFNPGGVFGLRYGGDLFYLLLSLVAIGFILYYYYLSHHRHRKFRFPLALVIGGAVGNLIDRLWFGKVLDFLDFDIPNITISDFSVFSVHFPGFMLDRWPVFNIADAAITIGVLLIILLLLLFPERQAEAEGAASEAGSSI
jgi:signal peptidase II